MTAPPFINWDTSNSNVSQPDAGHISQGWIPLEKPAVQHHNWLFQNIMNWIGYLNVMLPIGTILPFYDFGSAGPGGDPLPFDTGRFAYCDGTVISNSASPINGNTLPDLSDRYLVGFGTEGGGDIGTATWSTTPVGNADHEIDIQHDHSVPGLTVPGLSIPSLSVAGLSIPSLSVAGLSIPGLSVPGLSVPGLSYSGTTADWTHSHDPGTIQFEIAIGSATELSLLDSGGSSHVLFNNTSLNTGGAAITAVDFTPSAITYYTGIGSGSTGTSGTTGLAYSGTTSGGTTGGGTTGGGTTGSGSTGTGTTGSGSTGTDTTGTGITGTGTTGNALSTTQSIQPRSILVRFIMRVA